MNKVLWTICVVATIAVLGLGNPLSADTIPVFDYQFPDSSADLSSSGTGVVTDLSSAGNNAHTHGLFTGTGLSANVPAGMSGYSVDFTGETGIITDAKLLLDTQSVAANGGFMLDVWVYTTALPASGKTFTILSYAGTEQLRIDSGGRIEFNVSNSTTPNYLVESSALNLNTWYHVQAIFDTEGNEAVDGGSPTGAAGWYVNGSIELYIDEELVGSSSNSTKDSVGDNIDPARPIGIGKHPTGGGYMNGYIYNPSVSFLGQVPEPSTLSLLLAGLFGLLAYAWKKRK